MFKKHMTPLTKGGQTVKNAGKGSTEQMLPSRSAMANITSGDPAARTMQDYAKATPTIGAPSMPVNGNYGAGTD
jgi:hypothetical protein